MRRRLCNLCVHIGTLFLSLSPSFVHGILQAKILELVAIPFSTRSSQPREWTWVSQADFRQILYCLSHQGAFQVALVVKNPPASTGDVRDVGLSWVGPMDRGAWQATAHSHKELYMTEVTYHAHMLPPFLSSFLLFEASFSGKISIVLFGWSSPHDPCH